MSGSILCVDTRCDKVTRYCYAFRLNRIYQDTTLRKRWSFDHPPASQPDVDHELVHGSHAYITCSGHGIDTEYQDHTGAPIMSTSHITRSGFKDKIVHLLACEAGANLGQALVSHGKANAFFGYNSYFEIPYLSTLPSTKDSDWEFSKTEPYNPLIDSDAEICIQMDIEIDIAILYKRDAESTFDAAENYVVSKLGAHPPISAGVKRSLLHNFKSLVAPSVDFGGKSLWGDEAAQLA